MESQQHQRQVLLQHRWWGNELRFDSGFRFSQVGQIHFEDVSRNVTNIKNMTFWKEFGGNSNCQACRCLKKAPVIRSCASSIRSRECHCFLVFTKTDHLALMNHEISTPLPKQLLFQELRGQQGLWYRWTALSRGA